MSPVGDARRSARAQVTVACTSGTWQCTFPAGVCTGTAAPSATEVCDTLDNDCDGPLNENAPNYGQPCASDDGLPPPGHGAVPHDRHVSCAAARTRSSAAP